MPKNVMIVDDSQTIRRVVVRTMKMMGLNLGEVYEASNGIDALAQLHDHPVDALVVDINMPLMNGVQLVTRMKGNDRLKDIPVIIASTEGSKPRMEQLSELGVAAYVRKPFQPEQLRDALAPLLGVVENVATATDTELDDSAF